MCLRVNLSACCICILVPQIQVESIQGHDYLDGTFVCSVASLWWTEFLFCRLTDLEWNPDSDICQPYGHKLPDATEHQLAYLLKNIQSACQICGFCIYGFNQPWIENIFFKRSINFRKAKLEFVHNSNDLCSIYIVFTALSTAFTSFQIV